MPANLAEMNQKTMMAYQGDTPWHMLGEKVEDPETKRSVEKFLHAANLDWDVTLKPTYFRHGDRYVKVPNRRAVVRDTDGALLATVGGDYTPIQNRDAFAVLQPALDQFGVEIETAGALGKGDRVWMLARLPEDIEPVAGDKLKNYIFILAGHNGWTCYSGRLTQVRVVCANTVALAERDRAFVKLRHTVSETEQLTEVSKLVTHMLTISRTMNDTFKKMAAHTLTASELREYVENTLDLDYENPVAARRRDTVLELASRTGKGIEFAPDTLWSAYNAVTEYVDHVRPAEAKAPRTIKQANESALFGANMKIKLAALANAQRLVA